MALSRGRKVSIIAAALGVLIGTLIFVRTECRSFSKSKSAAETSKPLPALTNPRVVIVKSAHELTVFDGDQAVKTYRAAFGPGRGDKTREGDKCTPQGRFYVCIKNPNSRFTLSLGLSYPNIEDAERGLRDGLISRAQHDAIVEAVHARRQPPWNTTLGGEIMIHGCGSGSDWTLGCVALDDEDIRELYHALPLGTPVDIQP